jgi:FlaG/FlaF family flagellin (archaellin)
MVEITVILAAVIGAFVLDLGGNQQKTPSASFDWDQDRSAESADTNDETVTIEVTHEGGDSIDGTQVTMTVDGTEVSSSTNWDVDSGYGSSEITAGNTASFVTSSPVESTNDPQSASAIEGQTFRLSWSSEDGSSSATLASYEVN